MNKQTCSIHPLSSLFMSMLAACFLAGCSTAGKKSCVNQTASVKPVPAVPVAPAKPVIRINAGADADFTDSNGNIWLSDRGFEGGDIVTRDADLKIENAKDAALYRTEHWGMSSFSQPLSNGKYVVKLHFAETWTGIEGPGGRVFSMNVEGHETKDFDVWVKASGPRRAYVESVNIDIADGKLDITFEAGADNPEINAIEIIPAP